MGRRVLLFPLPYQGHINPAFQLSGLLHSRGFSITVFHTSFNAPDSSRHTAYDFVPIHDDATTPASTSTADTVQATVDHIFALNRACEAPFRARLAALLTTAPEREDDVACLVADAHLLTLLDVARALGVPTLVLRTGSAACFGLFIAFPVLCDRGYLSPSSAQGTHLVDTPVTELPPYRVRDLPFSSGGATTNGLIGELISRAVTAVKTSSGLILNTFDSLEADELSTLRRDLTAVPVFDVGPLHTHSPATTSSTTSSSLLEQDRACLAWLDTQAPSSVLYVSFGSLASMSLPRMRLG